MKKHSVDPHEIDEQARIYLIARLVVVYFVTIAAVAWGTVYYQLPLYKGDFLRWPTPWLWTIWFLYYVLPFVLAIVYGLTFRPFWRGFRNLWVTIIVVQLLFSFGANAFRMDYLQKILRKARWSHGDDIKIKNFIFKYFDRNQDGLKEELRVRAVFDLTQLRPGEYLLDASLINDEGKAGVEWLSLQGGETVKLAMREDKNVFQEEFVISPIQGVAPTYEEINFRIRLILSRIINVDEYGLRLFQFTRWSPFLRKTDWEGNDPEVYGDWIVLGRFTQPNVFTLRVLPKKLNYGND